MYKATIHAALTGYVYLNTAIINNNGMKYGKGSIALKAMVERRMKRHQTGDIGPL